MEPDKQVITDHYRRAESQCVRIHRLPSGQIPCYLCFTETMTPLESLIVDLDQEVKDAD